MKSIYFSSVVKNETEFFISKNMSYDSLLNILKNEYNIPDYACLKIYSDKKKLFNYKPGKYLLNKGYTFNDIINELRIYNNRKTINFSFNTSDDIKDLASSLSKKIDIDSMYFMNIIESYNYDSVFFSAPFIDHPKQGLFIDNFDLENLKSIFIPNKYNLYWHTSEKKFIERMIKEYKTFWSKKNRFKKAQKLGLSPFEVTIIASIVEKETNNLSEMVDVASLYLNRINKKMKLQADPTINYCFKKQYNFDTTLTRVFSHHLKIDCEHNTYIYQGIPPSPICIPSINSIDAVLNSDLTEYLYMCARSELDEKSKKICFFDSHVFAKTYFQHKKNARKYQKAIHKYQNDKSYEVCFVNRQDCNCQ